MLTTRWSGSAFSFESTARWSLVCFSLRIQDFLTVETETELVKAIELIDMRTDTVSMIGNFSAVHLTKNILVCSMTLFLSLL